jgi:hypothetical protein
MADVGSPTRKDQRSWHPARCAALFVALFVFCVTASAPAGQRPIPNPWEQRPMDAPEVDASLAAKQLRDLNTERQKSLVSDTEKLVKLAQQLNSEIAASHADTLTPSQLREVENIEKLARNVREKMSISLVGGPAFHDPVAPPFR